MAKDERPVYLRVRDTIAAMILDGRVRDGDALPSVRALAADYGANPLTVAKAYHGFQEEGLIIVKRGIGMFVAQGAAAQLLQTHSPVAAMSALALTLLALGGEIWVFAEIGLRQATTGTVLPVKRTER